MNKEETALRRIERKIDIPMPVLLTCPHGGKVQLLPRRDESNVNCGESGVRIMSDTNTIEVTEGIALNILRMGKRDVYKIIGIVDQSFIDFNRGPQCAYAPTRTFEKISTTDTTKKFRILLRKCTHKTVMDFDSYLIFMGQIMRRLSYFSGQMPEQIRINQRFVSYQDITQGLYGMKLVC